MLEIVQITKYYPPYFRGVPNYVQLLSEELKKQHRVTVLTSNTSFSRREEVDGNLRVIRLPRLIELRSAILCPTLPWELGRLHPDIVHLHFPDPMAHLAFWLARPPGKLIEMGPMVRHALGERARRRIEENFTLAKMVRADESLYERITDVVRPQTAHSMAN